MSWAEAARLTQVILKDPSSQLAADVSGWQHPASREWQAIAAVHNAVVDAHFEKDADSYIPRPWDAPRPRPTAMPREALTAILARHRALPPQQQEESRDLRPENN